MNIRYANQADIDLLHMKDHHIAYDELHNKVDQQQIIIIEEEGIFAGWLRYGLFWDNTPFMNMIYIIEEYQGKGYGKLLNKFWESEMKSKGYDFIMTSTLANESSQHFYRKQGYIDAGSLLLENEPLEIIFTKKLKWI